MSAFQTARFYELLGNRGGRLEREGPFLLEALARAPGRRVADIACGLGLHAVWLAEHNPEAEVRAFDASEDMVRHARETRPHPRVIYARGDMRAVEGGPYDLILCLGNSLSLLAEEDDLEQFFASAFSALTPGGVVITQTLNYATEAMRRPRIRVERENLSDGELAAVKRFQPQGERTMLSITYHVVTSAQFSDITETVTLRHWTADTLADTARQTGLTLDAAYGDYVRAPLGQESPDIILCMRRSGTRSEGVGCKPANRTTAIMQ